MASETAKASAVPSAGQNAAAATPVQYSAKTGSAAEPPGMKEAELESHSVATNVERYAFLLIVSTAIIVGAVLGWFYFHS